jgi:hypothetical protein
MSDETRAKFLAAIAAKVGADRVEEAHVFPAIKQGGTENGVAVVAVRALDLANPSVTPPHGDPLAAEIVGSDAEATFDAPHEDAPIEADDPRPAPRLIVYSAKYRLTLKGPERGKWEFSMQAEADAPLVTVETVVRGVQKRSGDVDDPEKLSGDEFRAVLPAVDGSAV